MTAVQSLVQPSLKQLLQSEILAEAQVLYEFEKLERRVAQIVACLNEQIRPGSLLVTTTASLSKQDVGLMPMLCGIILVRTQNTGERALNANRFAMDAEGVAEEDADIGALRKLCVKTDTALIILSSYGHPERTIEDIRAIFMNQIKDRYAQMHARYLALVIDEGIQSLVEELSNSLGRPVALETVDFKMVASVNMNPTPSAQQSRLMKETEQAISRRTDLNALGDSLHIVHMGRRLVAPVLLNEQIVGFFSVMLQSSDPVDVVCEFLQPAVLAAMVNFSRQHVGTTAFTATQKSLLIDLLAGRSLTAADQERLEQHFGFDLCEGLLVFAVKMIPAHPEIVWTDEHYVSVQVEGTHVFVMPYKANAKSTWQQEADKLVKCIKTAGNHKAVQRVVQLGAGRLCKTIMDLPDSYRESRQALIIGSMVYGEKEFVTGYGDLGVRRLLYLIIDHPEIDRFYEENLAPLAAYDSEWESELVPTLKVYLSQGANLNSAARALYIHRHTLRYRLEQIAEVLKVDMDSQEVLLNLQIAVLISEMKGKLKI